MSFTADQTATVGSAHTSSGSLTVSCSFGTLPSSASVIVVGLWTNFSFTGQTITITDSSGNAYFLARDKALSKSTNNPYLSVWTTGLGGLTIPGSPPLTLTATLPSADTFVSMTAKSYTSTVNGTIIMDVGAFGFSIPPSAAGIPPTVQVISGIPNRANELFIGVSLKNTLGTDTLTAFGDLTLVAKNEDGNAGEQGLMCDLASVDSNPHFFGMDWASASSADVGGLLVPFYVEPYITMEQVVLSAAVGRAGNM